MVGFDDIIPDVVAGRLGIGEPAWRANCGKSSPFPDVVAGRRGKARQLSDEIDSDADINNRLGLSGVVAGRLGKAGQLSDVKDLANEISVVVPGRLGIGEPARRANRGEPPPFPDDVAGRLGNAKLSANVVGLDDALPDVVRGRLGNGEPSRCATSSELSPSPKRVAGSLGSPLKTADGCTGEATRRVDCGEVSLLPRSSAAAPTVRSSNPTALSGRCGASPESFGNLIAADDVGRAGEVAGGAAARGWGLCGSVGAELDGAIDSFTKAFRFHRGAARLRRGSSRAPQRSSCLLCFIASMPARPAWNKLAP